MQLTIEIKDDFVKDFIQYAKTNDIKITEKELSDDEKLVIDPYFYQRREYLHKLSADIESGKIEMLSHNEYNQEMQRFLNKL